AAAAFEAKHYVDVTVDDISDRAGTSRATFYLYYPGKAKILTDCLREFDQGLAELWDQFEALDEVTLQALEAWLASYVELYEKHKLLLNTMDQAEAVEPEFRDKTIATTKDTIARWQRLDAVKSVMKPDDDLELRLLLFTAELQRFLSLWIIHGIAVDRAKAVRKLAEHWYAVLAGDR
ncbi:MAG: TetR/AcrR family transcriptional regulator, partial [Jiangellaceae bacterium]